MKIISIVVGLWIIQGVRAAQPVGWASTQICQLVNEWRATNGLAAVPVSPAMDLVARIHADNLNKHHNLGDPNCNMHSWYDEPNPSAEFSNYNWNSCCYTNSPGPVEFNCMNMKGTEITSLWGDLQYHGASLENSYFSSFSSTPEQIVNMWKNSPGHNALLLGGSPGREGSLGLHACGAAIQGRYAVLWMGRGVDPMPIATGPTPMPTPPVTPMPTTVPPTRMPTRPPTPVPTTVPPTPVPTTMPVPTTVPTMMPPIPTTVPPTPTMEPPTPTMEPPTPTMEPPTPTMVPPTPTPTMEPTVVPTIAVPPTPTPTPTPGISEAGGLAIGLMILTCCIVCLLAGGLFVWYKFMNLSFYTDLESGREDTLARRTHVTDRSRKRGAPRTPPDDSIPLRELPH